MYTDGDNDAGDHPKHFERAIEVDQPTVKDQPASDHPERDIDAGDHIYFNGNRTLQNVGRNTFDYSR